jgi:hypothetical protein
LQDLSARQAGNPDDAFWQYDSPRRAGWFLRKWCVLAVGGKLFARLNVVVTP